MATIHEKFDSREATEGFDSPSVDLLYVVQGTEDDVEVRTLVEGVLPVYRTINLDCELPVSIRAALTSDDL